jgi:hypothetical protein
MAKFESIASDSTASESVESESAAIVDLEQAVRLDPDHRPSWQRLGQVGRYGDTAPCLIRAAELKPASVRAAPSRAPLARHDSAPLGRNQRNECLALMGSMGWGMRSTSAATSP